MVEWSSMKAPCWESRWIVLFFYFAPELPFCQVAANTACLLGISSDPPLEGLKLGHPSRPRPARRTHHRTSIGAHQSTQGERHDHHRPNHSNETSPDGLTEEDRACRGRALSAYLCLYPDTPYPRPRACTQIEAPHPTALHADYLATIRHRALA